MIFMIFCAGTSVYAVCIHENGKNYLDGITSLIYKSCPTTSFAAYREDNSPFDK